MSVQRILMGLLIHVRLAGCGKKSSDTPAPPPAAVNFVINSATINGAISQTLYYNINPTPLIRFNFSAKIDRGTIAASFYLKDASGTSINYSASYERSDSTV